MSKPAAAKGKTAAQEKIAAKLREERTIAEKLNFEGLARKDVPKDGACLFRAIAEHIYQSQAHHLLVRDECLDFIEMNREAFEPFICADGVRFDHYIAEMRKSNAWGGQVELQAASMRYGVNFDIITTQANHTVVDNGFKKAISLCFTHGNHYDTVYPIRRFELEKICQGLLYEIIDKAIGVSPPAGGYIYRNVEIDVWRRGVEEQKKIDAERAQKLHEESKNLSGYYKKENEPDEGEMTPARRRRNKKKNKQIVHIPLSVVADSPKNKKKPAAEAAEEEDEEELEIEVEPKIDINAEELFPTLKPKPTPPVPKTPTTAPAAASPSLNTQAASPATASGGAAAQPAAGNKWGQQRNWNTVFTAPAAAAVARGTNPPAASAANATPAVATAQPALVATTPTVPVAPASASPAPATPAATDSKPAATPTRSPKTSQQGGENSPANLNRPRDGAAAVPAASFKGAPAANGNNVNSKKASRENVPTVAAGAAQPKGGADTRPKVVWSVPMKKSTEGSTTNTDLSLTFGNFGPSAAASSPAPASVPVSPSPASTPPALSSPTVSPPIVPGAASAAATTAPPAKQLPAAAHPPPHSPMAAPPPHAWATLPPHAQQAAMQHAYYYGLPPFGSNGPYAVGAPPAFFVQGMPGPMYAMPPPFHPMSPPHQ